MTSPETPEPRRRALLLRLDTYDLRARILPALIVAAPAVALAVTLQLDLTGAHRLWSLIGIAVWPLVTAVTRRLGAAAQPGLWASWDGAPTTHRLRWATGPPSVISARHAEIHRVLGNRVGLPAAAEETSDPGRADAVYADVARRLFGLTRNDQRFALLHRENANYGFARNLYGARHVGLFVSAATLVLALSVGIFITVIRDAAAAASLLLPTLLSIGALAGWTRLVTSALVRPPADALADRLLEALQTLADDQPDT